MGLLGLSHCPNDRQYNENTKTIIKDLYDKKQSCILVMGHYGNWEWAGNTLKVSSVSTASRPRLPTSSFGRSKPAAFFTTRPPARASSPAPLTNCTPKIKSRNPPKRQRPGPFKPLASAPPSVAPRAAKGGSNGKYWLCRGVTVGQQQQRSL